MGVCAEAGKRGVGFPQVEAVSTLGAAGRVSCSLGLAGGWSHLAGVPSLPLLEWAGSPPCLSPFPEEGGVRELCGGERAWCVCCGVWAMKRRARWAFTNHPVHLQKLFWARLPPNNRSYLKGKEKSMHGRSEVHQENQPHTGVPSPSPTALSLTGSNACAVTG